MQRTVAKHLAEMQKLIESAANQTPPDLAERLKRANLLGPNGELSLGSEPSGNLFVEIANPSGLPDQIVMLSNNMATDAVSSIRLHKDERIATAQQAIASISSEI